MSYTLEDIKKGVIGTDSTQNNSVIIYEKGLQRILVTNRIGFYPNTVDDLFVFNTETNAEEIISTRNWTTLTIETYLRDYVTLQTTQTITGSKVFNNTVLVTNKESFGKPTTIFTYTKTITVNRPTILINNLKDSTRFLVLTEESLPISRDGDPSNIEQSDFILREFIYNGENWDSIIVDGYKIYSMAIRQLMRSIRFDKLIGGVFSYGGATFKFYENTILVSSSAGYNIDNNGNYTHVMGDGGNGDGSVLVYKKINNEWKLWCFGTNLINIRGSLTGEGSGIINENYIVLSDLAQSKYHIFNISSETYPYWLTINKRVQQDPPAGQPGYRFTNDNFMIENFGSGMWASDKFLFISAWRTRKTENGRDIMGPGVLRIFRLENLNEPYNEITNKFIPVKDSNNRIIDFYPLPQEPPPMHYGHFSSMCTNKYGLVIGKNCIDVYEYNNISNEWIQKRLTHSYTYNDPPNYPQPSVPVFGKIIGDYIFIYNKQYPNTDPNNNFPLLNQTGVYQRQENGNWVLIDKIDGITSENVYGGFITFSNGYTIYETQDTENSNTYKIIARQYLTNYPLEIDSDTNGILLPRLTQEQISKIEFVQAGTVLYNKTFNKLQVRYLNNWEFVLTSSDLDQIIVDTSNFVTYNDLNSLLATYVTQNNLNNTLQNYLLKNEFELTLQPYLQNYVTIDYFLDYLHTNLNNYITREDLEIELSTRNYLTESMFFGFLTDYIGSANLISESDLENYLIQNNYITAIELSNYCSNFITIEDVITHLQNNHYVNQNNITQYIPVAYIEQIIQNYLNNQGGQ